MSEGAPLLVELERLVLGAALYEPWGGALVEKLPVPEMFGQPRHQQAWQIVLALAQRNLRPSPELVEQELLLLGRLPREDSFFLYGLPHGTPYESMQGHVEQLRAHATLRLVHQLGQRLQRVALAGAAADVLHAAGTELADVQRQLVQRTGASFLGAVDEAFEYVRRAFENKGALTGPTSGFRSVDNITGGWQPADLIIMGARPGMGKTMVVGSMARACALEQLQRGTGKRVALFSLEMSRAQLAMRELAAFLQIDSTELRRGLLPRGYSLAELRALIVAHYGTLPVYYDDTANVHINDLVTTVRRLHDEQPLAMLIIDYLQLMGGTGNNREQEIASISRKLKMLAKELDIPVLALSQVSRGVETRPDKRPHISDLRESGALEQDADVIVFLYRPEYYQDADELGRPIREILEVDFAKHRSGSLEKALLSIQVKYSLLWDPTQARPASLLDQPPTARLPYLG